jgi:hypothetical protein
VHDCKRAASTNTNTQVPRLWDEYVFSHTLHQKGNDDRWCRRSGHACRFEACSSRGPFVHDITPGTPIFRYYGAFGPDGAQPVFYVLGLSSLPLTHRLDAAGLHHVRACH